MTPLIMAMVEAGILSQGDADRIERQLDPDAARAYAYGLLTDAFRRGLSLQQRRILEWVDDTQGTPTLAQINRFWRGEDELLWASVEDELHTVAMDAAVSASVGVVTDENTWRLVNEDVLAWVDDYYLNADIEAAGSIPNLNVTSRTQFAQALRDWQRGELELVGFDEGLPALIRSLEPTFGASRATRIAVTETTRIFGESERAAGEANELVVGWVYHTANDSHVSEFCRGANGLVMLKGQSTFPDGRGFPPRHVNCRSSVTAITQGALDALREQNG
jgi:SPP1 gp7 family putative phage head morphogenesis protein